jgi:hypothetical protein
VAVTVACRGFFVRSTISDMEREKLETKRKKTKKRKKGEKRKKRKHS